MKRRYIEGEDEESEERERGREIIAKEYEGNNKKIKQRKKNREE